MEHLKHAAPWARDNIGWGMLMLIAPPLAVFLRHRGSSIDWSVILTTLYLYIATFLLYGLVHICKAVVKLDSARQKQIAEQASELTQLRTKLESLHLNSLPWRAIGLCKEINAFVATLGPQQDYQYSSDMSPEQFTQLNAEQSQRESKMEAGFYLRFTRRVIDTYNEFCEDGMEDKQIEQALGQRMDM
jgi:hypothetical protein